MHFAFLSSPVVGLRDIREAVFSLNLPGNQTIFVDECVHPLSEAELLARPWQVTLEDLFRKIRESSIFLILLGSDKTGTELMIRTEAATVTYWEAELFYAVLLGKPVQVFVVEGFKPAEKLSALLTMLRGALPKEAWSEPYSRKKITPAIYDFLEHRVSIPVERSGRRNRSLQMLVDGFHRLRGGDGIGGTAEEESLRFLDGRLTDTSGVPNVVVVSSLLDEVQTISNEEGRLTRLWLVFRELSRSLSPQVDSRAFLPYWNRFYGEWASAGSWYGLHGHLHLAVLAALVEQTKTRGQMMAEWSSEWKGEDTTYPGGALASSRYSIACNSGSLGTRRTLLHAALADLARSMQEGPGSETNLLAIRGSVHLRLGAIRAAVEDYEEVLGRREHAGASDRAVGEAMSELGFGYLFQLQFWRGCSLLEEGVRLLPTGDPRSGFLIRALRKLAVAYTLTGQGKRAREVAAEARKLANEKKVLDQIN